VFHSNISSVTHSSPDNEMFSRPEVALSRFLRKDAPYRLLGLITCFEKVPTLSYSRLIDIFRLTLTRLKLFDFSFWLEKPMPNHFWVVFRVKHSNIAKVHHFNQQKGFQFATPRVLIYCSCITFHWFWCVDQLLHTTLNDILNSHNVFYRIDWAYN